MRVQARLSTLILGALTVVSVAGAPAIGAQQSKANPPYKRDLPAALMREAKVSEADARKVALSRVANGRIQAVELEREDGKLLYSYELKVPAKSGIEEVNVDAITGLVASVEHETPAIEHGEMRKEQQEASHARAAGGRTKGH